MNDKFPGIFLLAAVFVIAICGLVYELIAGAMSSYLLGASITQFSIVIGVFLTAMGIGSYLTRFVPDEALMDTFVAVQIGIGVSGGFSAALLFFAFATAPNYLVVLIGVLTVTGTLVGMEIPLLIRILRTQESLKITVSNVLALDYIGALFASCMFPLVLAPLLGLLRTSFMFGLINIFVAFVGLRVLRNFLRQRRRLLTGAVISGVLLCVGLVESGSITSFAENLLYQDKIFFATQTPYQKIVMTRWHNDVRLYIDGHLQFSTVDEHRYHECLVHPAIAACPGAKRVLILGGGDGMTAREALKYPDISIDLVDLDETVVKLFRDNQLLSHFSNEALKNPRLKVHIDDAGKFLENSEDYWDVIFIDLPDPSNLSISRLYTGSFYRLIFKRLSQNGVMVTQATSPFYAKDSFWCIVKTLKETTEGPEGKKPNVYPYHVYVPSFGDWGFIMASRKESSPDLHAIPENLNLKFIGNENIASLFTFPKDTMPVRELQANTLNTQSLVNYYRRDWKRFNR
jgi:spermidine synthase